MFIAFEGPDKTGKSTSADNLAFDGKGIYNVTKEVHEEWRRRREMSDQPNLPVTYDRIDWLTHMVYRLALPDYEWNDERVRTVFTMPDTHLVFKLHNVNMVYRVHDELYKEDQVAVVNDMYWRTARWLTNLNMDKEYALFKSVSVLEVLHPKPGHFSTRLIWFSSPVFKFIDVAKQRVHDDETLLEMLRYEDSKRL